MNSLHETALHRLYRMKGEIYQEADLKACLKKLKLQETDLIITSNSQIEKIKETNALGKAALLNMGAYGTKEPKEEWVDEILKKANAYPYERIIAIGGGAVIDVSKLCVFGDGRSVQELYSDKSRLIKTRELIALPTTCGTGSEITNVSVVEFPSLHSKLGLQMDALFPDKAILIGELLISLPYKTFALTSIDALSHAIEALLSPKANPYTDMYARSAILGIIENLQEVKGARKLPQDMQKSLICANMAGIAFSLAGCATMHALSFPLGANCQLAHGEAVYAVFAQTLQYYQKKQISLCKLENVLKDRPEGPCSISELKELLSEIYPCPDFKALGINEGICDTWAVSVYEKQQRLLANSPCVLSSGDLAAIYKSCI
ncbi:iron-containing alcohol dehydrogenase [[Clostridium] innocuum]|nr:iron-containing alcohol dehydrogenase [[Clostridium] innocuum]